MCVLEFLTPLCSCTLLLEHSSFVAYKSIYYSSILFEYMYQSFLTLGTHAHEGYSTLFVCLSVCLLPVSWFLFTFI